MATKTNPPAKKSAPAKKGASAKKAAPVKEAAGAKAGKPVRPKATRSGDHPAPVVGELCVRGGALGILVGKDFYPLDTIAEGHSDAELTLYFKFSNKDVKVQTKRLSAIAEALGEFLQRRAIRKPRGGATCCHSES